MVVIYILSVCGLIGFIFVSAGMCVCVKNLDEMSRRKILSTVTVMRNMIGFFTVCMCVCVCVCICVCVRACVCVCKKNVYREVDTNRKEI